MDYLIYLHYNSNGIIEKTSKEAIEEMRVVKLSDLSSYQIEYDKFRYGEYYKKDLAEKNRFYDKIYVCVNEENEILALAYMGQERGTVYFDCMSVRDDLKKQGIGSIFVEGIKEIFPDVPLKALPQENSIAFWLKNGFKHRHNSYILIYEPSQKDQKKRQ